jgi:radical SAM enzyme (TIGR01210 family)
MRDLRSFVEKLFQHYGPSKPMAEPSTSDDQPNFFLTRKFLGEQDLLIIFRSRRCRYQCDFCDLPLKNPRALVSAESIVEQFAHVLSECRHALGLIDRITLSNDGSVLDDGTFPAVALGEIFAATSALKALRRVVVETRLEFVHADRLAELNALNPRVMIDVLTGFETHSEVIRDSVLRKREPLSTFLDGLDQVGAAGASLTAYVLYKPWWKMSNEQAWTEAEASVRFLQKQCQSRGIPLVVRLNPMYAAARSAWWTRAQIDGGYEPPALADVFRFAKWCRQAGVPSYVGLSSEGLAAPGSEVRVRSDTGRALVREVALFNGHYEPERAAPEH